MKVGLFVPCYVDQFYPFVAVATLELLEGLGCDVYYPPDQTCCGQPMANAGCELEGARSHQRFLEQFSACDFVVGPSGSCVLHVRERVAADIGQGERTYELCQFLTDVLEITGLDTSFPHRVGLHAACHGLRGLGLARPSEVQAPPFDHVARLLEMVDGLELVDLSRPDECCGFGGTFSVGEEAVSVRMGRDRLADLLSNGVDVVTSTDMSCLMHLEGLARREERPLRVLHIAEILAGNVDQRRALFAGGRS